MGTTARDGVRTYAERCYFRNRAHVDQNVVVSGPLCEVNLRRNSGKTMFFCCPQSDMLRTPVSFQWRSCGGCWPYSQGGPCICTCAQTLNAGRLRTRLAHVTARSSRTRADVAQQKDFCNSPPSAFCCFPRVVVEPYFAPDAPTVARATRARDQRASCRPFGLSFARSTK